MKFKQTNQSPSLTVVDNLGTPKPAQTKTQFSYTHKIKKEKKI